MLNDIQHRFPKLYLRAAQLGGETDHLSRRLYLNDLSMGSLDPFYRLTRLPLKIQRRFSLGLPGQFFWNPINTISLLVYLTRGSIAIETRAISAIHRASSGVFTGTKVLSVLLPLWILETSKTMPQ